jgi:hypothetical protein
MNYTKKSLNDPNQPGDKTYKTAETLQTDVQIQKLYQ